MKRELLAVVVVLCIGAMGVAAQTGPEHQKLGVFVGNWTFAGEAVAGPMGPGGKITGTHRISWLPDKMSIERQYEGKGPGGDMKGREVMAYDAAKKVYTFSYTDSSGAKGSGTITVKDNTWNATGTGDMGGVKFQERCTLTFGAGNTTLNISCQGSADGKTWAPTMSGVATKTK